MQPLTLTKHDIQALGGPSADRLSRAEQRAKLEAAGFPAPLPGMHRPLRWSRAAVTAWLNACVAPPPPALDTDGAQLAERLAARSRAIAAGTEP